MSRSIRQSLNLVLALVLACGSAPVLLAGPAIDQAAIDGRILSPDMTTPVADLQVQAFVDGTDTPVATTRTDRQGRFTVENLDAGDYILLFLEQDETPVAATRLGDLAERRSVILALPQLEPGQSPVAPAQAGGMMGWIASPIGAAVAIVAATVVVAVAADAALDDDEDEVDLSPVVPE
jgi:hypothetical protein